MLSGRRLDILDPSPLDVELDDIAHGLARVARWNGQTSGPFVYSVAQHSCLVEALAVELDPGLADSERLALLLHDAPEYVMGDVITPLKAALGDGFATIERRLLQAVHIAFGLPAELPPALASLLKRADRIAAWIEATELAGFSRPEAMRTFGRPELVPASVAPLLVPWPSEVAESRFRERVAVCAATKQSGHPPGL
ncbi:hydrolase [uncultured Enterovirga sp.]|uniref:hydrolase n=1 Tax=uncultured Enterovirga sp. TaxID=2026352 RepID=UPI0035CA6103